ncbi:hypothetical protein, partial [Endozoicomonas sp. ONNA2]|uniref:hypothetical protein n=1 Tax=Endozoicomonas sp. ONNA2 TaxID=2828741 RepID=UPI0021496BA9
SAAGNNHVHALRDMGAKLSMEQLAEAKKEAERMDSPWGSKHICAIMEMMLEQALRDVMCNFSNEGLDIVLNLVEKEDVRLFSEDCTQFLREALRISAGGNKIVDILLKMGATLPDEEQPQFLKDALRLNTAAGDNHAAALGKMGATLPREELEQMLREARSTQRRVTATITILEEMISKHQEPAVS